MRRDVVYSNDLRCNSCLNIKKLTEISLINSPSPQLYNVPHQKNYHQSAVKAQKYIFRKFENYS